LIAFPLCLNLPFANYKQVYVRRVDHLGRDARRLMAGLALPFVFNGIQSQPGQQQAPDPLIANLHRLEAEQRDGPVQKDVLIAWDIENAQLPTGTPVAEVER
jgi:hypothetical protein